MYEKRDFSIDVLPRARAVATAYMHYRIKKISLTFKPTVDTFAAGGVNGAKPDLYVLIDKSGAVPTNATFDALRSMGAKARALDEKPLTVSWRPSVLMDAASNPGPGFAVSPANYKISPWLTTNATPLSPGAWTVSTVDHLGVFFFAQDPYPGASPTHYTVDVTIDVEFKKPLNSTLQNDGPPAVRL